MGTRSSLASKSPRKPWSQAHPYQGESEYPWAWRIRTPTRGKRRRGTVSERRRLGVDAVAKDGIFPSPHVVLEATQVINSHGDRTVHYIVSLSMERNVRLRGL